MEKHQELVEKYSSVITERLLVILETFTGGEFVVEDNSDKIIVKQLLSKYLNSLISELENNG